jgi:nuclear pore complex protein Nup205
MNINIINYFLCHYFILEKINTEDMWTPYKELQNLVERYVTSSPSTLDPQFHEFTETLRNHRQNFLTLLKNPVSIFIN